MPRFDTNETKELDGSLPDGTYLARVTSSEFQYSKKKGTPGFRLGLEIADGPYEHRMIFETWWVTEKTLPSVKKMLNVTGAYPADGILDTDDEEAMDRIAANVEGKLVDLRIRGTDDRGWPAVAYDGINRPSREVEEGDTPF